MMKKILALVLALTICAGILAGCAQDGDKKPGGDVVIGGNTEGPLFSKVTDIELYTVADAAYDLPGSYAVDLLLEQENIRLNVTEAMNMEQWLTDHDVPDIVRTNANMWGNEYGPKGAFINILDYIDQMPNLKKALEANPESVKFFLAEDGGLYHIPNIMEGNTTPYAFIYRKDIFEKHNLTFPTTRDEFVEVLRKLKELYPNSYPFVMRQMNTNMQGLMYLCMSFGTSMALTGSTQTVMDFDDKTGTWYHGPTSEGMKDLVGFLNQLYSEGLLHKSTITLTPAQWVEAFVKGDDAAGASFIGFDKMDRIPAQLQPEGEALNPEFQLASAGLIKFNELGEAATYAEGVTAYNFLISSSAENLDACLAYIDWLYSEEGVRTTNWGKEGETFEYDAEGNPKWLDSVKAENDPQFTRGLGLPGLYGIRDFDAYLGWQTEEHKANLELANSYATLPARPSLTYNKDEQAIYDTYSQGLYGFVRGELQKFIAGERPMSEWDNYVQVAESDAYEFSRLLQIHKDAYARMLENEVDVDELLNP